MHDLACSTQYLPVQHPVAIVLYSMQEYTVSNALEPIKRLRVSLNYKRVYKGRIAAVFQTDIQCRVAYYEPGAF